MSQGPRIPREIATKIVAVIRDLCDPTQVIVAGSYRRGCETVGDLDLVVADEGYRQAVSSLMEDAGWSPIRLKKDASVVGFVATDWTGALLRVELYRAKPGMVGAALLFATGDAQFNVRHRALAKRQGLKLSQHALFRGGTIIAGETEEEIFEAMGMPFILPAEREGGWFDVH